MSTKAKLLACLAVAAIPCLLAVAAQSADETSPYQVTTIIPVPGGLTSFDIAFVDANIQTFVLADRTNKSIDVVDTSTNTMTHQYTATPAFRGVFNPGGLANASGPNGVIIVDQREIWATDAPVLNCAGSPQVCTVVTPSSIKVISLATGATTHVIYNGGARRADELCEDVKREIVMSANDDPIDNFLTFISTETYSIIGSNHKLDGSDPNFKIKLTPMPAGATNVAADGIEQCKFNPRTGSYYLAIPATTVTTATGTTGGPGVVLKISRHAPFHIEATFTIGDGCAGPQGLAIGPRHEIVLGCGNPGANSLIIDDRDGHTIAVLTGKGGADEVWYNPGDNSYFIARSTAGKLSVVDSGSSSSPPSTDADVVTTIGSHVVAADMLKNQIYVPVRSNNVGGTCTPLGNCATLCGPASTTGLSAQGCIAVLTSANDDKCLAQGMPVLDHDDGDDPVFMRTRCRDEDDNEREARR